MDNVGTTAPLSPNNPQEQDMGKVREVFDRAVNAMIDATNLAKEVSELRLAVNELKNDIEYVRSRNRELDTLLTDVRTQRDNAMSSHKQVMGELAETTAQRDEAQLQNNKLMNELGDLRQSLLQTHKERDDATLEAMQLRDDLDKANAKLKGIMDTLGVKVEEPKPQSEDYRVNPYPTPSEMNQPEPGDKPTKRRIYEGEEGYPFNSYQSGSMWDNEKSQYYIER